jgi:hypothetical protein
MHQGVMMRRIVASLSAVLLLAAVTAVAQDRMKDPPKSGHEGMAKASGAPSAAAVIAKATSAAPPDIGRNAALMGIGADGQMKELRAGTNWWRCMLDLAGDSMCQDKEWQAWGDAWMSKMALPKPQMVGVAYMLKGDKDASNTDPYVTKPTANISGGTPIVGSLLLSANTQFAPGSQFSVTTGSITPVSGQVIVAFFVTSTVGGANHVTVSPTLTGTNGLNVAWTNLSSPITSYRDSVGAFGISIFRGVPSSGAAGTLTLSWTRDAIAEAAWNILTFSGVDQTTNQGVVQRVRSQASQPISVTMAAFGNSANATVMGCAWLASGGRESWTPKTGYTGYSTIPPSHIAMGTEWIGSADTNPTAVLGSNGAGIQLGIELKSATPAIDLPTVTTQAVSAVAQTTATGNGTISATGGVNADARGIVYSTSSQGLPGNVAPASSGYSGLVNETSGSFGTGVFTEALASLTPNTTYFVRAYAHNSAGYAYGGEVSFATLSAAKPFGMIVP